MAIQVSGWGAEQEGQGAKSAIYRTSLAIANLPAFPGPELAELDAIDARGTTVVGRYPEFEVLEYDLPGCNGTAADLEIIDKTILNSRMYDKARVALKRIAEAPDPAPSQRSSWLWLVEAWLEVAWRATGLLPYYYAPGDQFDVPASSQEWGPGNMKSANYGTRTLQRSGAYQAYDPIFGSYSTVYGGAGTGTSFQPPLNFDGNGASFNVGPIQFRNPNAGGALRYGYGAPRGRALRLEDVERYMGGRANIVRIRGFGNQQVIYPGQTIQCAPSQPPWECARFYDAIDQGWVYQAMQRIGEGQLTEAQMGAIHNRDLHLPPNVSIAGDIRVEPGKFVVRGLAPSTGVCLGANNCPTQTYFIMQGASEAQAQLIIKQMKYAARQVASTSLPTLWYRAGRLFSQFLGQLGVSSASAKASDVDRSLAAMEKGARDLQTNLTVSNIQTGGNIALDIVSLTGVGYIVKAAFNAIMVGLGQLAIALGDVIPPGVGALEQKFMPRFPFYRAVKSGACQMPLPNATVAQMRMPEPPPIVPSITSGLPTYTVGSLGTFVPQSSCPPGYVVIDKKCQMPPAPPAPAPPEQSNVNPVLQATKSSSALVPALGVGAAIGLYLMNRAAKTALSAPLGESNLERSLRLSKSIIRLLQDRHWSEHATTRKQFRDALRDILTMSKADRTSLHKFYHSLTDKKRHLRHDVRDLGVAYFEQTGVRIDHLTDLV